MAYKYTLEKYNPKNRFKCPSCNKEKVFTRYIDTQTGCYISDNVGRCSREIKCGYHFKPKQYFQENNCIPSKKFTKSYLRKKPSIIQAKAYSSIPAREFKDSLCRYHLNNFTFFLINHFGVENARKAISRYFLGTSDHFRNAVVFWLIDCSGKIRTGKIMGYCPLTCKRIKEPFVQIDWMHRLLKKPDFRQKQCFFGEHLLKLEPNKPVAIVESEKTAIICSIFFPEFVWLASGGLSNLNIEKCKVLKGRRVVLFPDIDGYDKWTQKVNELQLISKFTVSDFLIRFVDPAEKVKGMDLADYLLKWDVIKFFKPWPLISEIVIDEQIVYDPIRYHMHEFNDIIQVTIETVSGKIYEMLIDQNDNFIAEKSNLVLEIEVALGKKFVSGYFHGEKCLIYEDRAVYTYEYRFLKSLADE